MIKIHLSRVLGEKRISRSRLAKATGIRPNTIGDIYSEFVLRLSVDHLDKICEVLNCPISDLLEYVPNKKSRTGKSLIREEHGNRKK